MKYVSNSEIFTVTMVKTDQKFFLIFSTNPTKTISLQLSLVVSKNWYIDKQMAMQNVTRDCQDSHC